MKKLYPAFAAFLIVLSAVSCQSDGKGNDSWHSLIEESDRLAAGVVGVGAGTLGNLQNNGSLLLLAGLSDGLNDLHVVDVESADGVAAVVSLLEHLGSINKSHWNQSFLNSRTAARIFSFPIIT